MAWNEIRFSAKHNHFPFIKHEFLLDVRQGQRCVYGTTSLNRDGLLYQREKIRKIYQEIAKKTSKVSREDEHASPRHSCEDLDR